MTDEERRKRHREAYRRWRTAHLETERKRVRQYHVTHLEACREAARRWYAANREKKLERDRQRRASDPEKFRKEARQRRETNPEKAREAVRRYRTAHSDKVREQKRRRYATNPEYAREYARQWRAANPEFLREKRRQLQKAHPEKIRVYCNRRRARRLAAPGSFSADTFRALCEAVSWQCAYCPKVLDIVTAQNDHVVPLSRGGSNGIENIAVACGPCNASKNAHEVVGWMKRTKRTMAPPEDGFTLTLRLAGSR